MKGILKHNDYAFVDKHSIVDAIRTAIQDSGEPLEYIARSAGVHHKTLEAWLSGRTRKPYTTSIEAVARALGKRLSLVEGDMRLVDPPPIPAAISRRHAAWSWRRYQ